MAKRSSNRRAKWIQLMRSGYEDLVRELVKLGQHTLQSVVRGLCGYAWSEGGNLLVYRMPGEGVHIVAADGPRLISTPEILLSPRVPVDPGWAQALVYHFESSPLARSQFSATVR
ncbi:MAG: hypothetical protein WC080_03035 [Patescibacteria group bacterium]